MKGVGGLIPVASLMILAFAIGDTCDTLGTGPFVANAIKSTLAPGIIPAVVFLVSCFIAFSTGTSWGTFAIMIPIAVPMIQIIGLHPGLVIAAVLSGGVFGDHCSPISDTTIISSMASAADHIDHVRTQLPYAMVVALVAALCGYVPVGFGVAPWLSLLLGCLAVVILVFWLGRPVSLEPGEGGASEQDRDPVD